MSRRLTPSRTSGFAVLAVLLALVGSLLAVAPAQATEVDKTIGYRCSSSFGGGKTGVRIQVSIPDRIAQGVTVPSRRVTFKIKVPAELVDALRQYHVDSISGRGHASYSVGSLVRPIRKLRLPDTPVPASGGMTLKGHGRAAEFAINQAGTYRVKVTRSLTATATVHGGLGDGMSADLTCNVRRGESRTLASVEVIR